MKLDRNGMAHRTCWVVAGADGTIIAVRPTRAQARATASAHLFVRIRKALMIYAVVKPGRCPRRTHEH